MRSGTTSPGKPSEEQDEPFPVFITWISSEKSVWECMASTSGSQSSNSYFVDPIEVAGNQKKYFGCGEVGHVRRLCPNKNKISPGGGGLTPRKKPQVKKFWCAMHKGDP